MEENLLTNKEKYEAKRQEKLKSQVVAKTRQRFKKVALFGAVGIVFLAFASTAGYFAMRSLPSQGEVLSRNGLHWHAELAIYVNNEKQDIPADIGLETVHKPVHTHDEKDTIHMEFPGLVRKQDLALGEFFKNWGKDMRSFGANMKMTVNGQENMEYEKYIMQDKDIIELRFE